MTGPARRFFGATLLLALFAVCVSLAAPSSRKHQYLVYVGTYTQPESTSQGIYAYRFDPDSASLSSLGLAASTPNPSFLAAHPNRRFLYAVNEVADYKGPNSGGVSAFAIDRATGKLTFLNEVSSRGANPCHVTVDKSGKYVLVANYTGGSVAAFPILADGRLGDASAFIQHAGHSLNPERQESPHAHSIGVSADNRFVLVGDLGLDELLVYRFDASKGSLAPNDPKFAGLAPGSGPRHFSFHPGGRLVYVINELQSSVTVFAYDPEGGALHAKQTISTLPAGFTAQNTAAEIEVHPSGKFLYASNRGHDSIAVFAVDPVQGTLTLTEHVSTQGKAPRNFTIDPAGSFLLVANQKSDSVVTFRIDLQTGRLTPAGKVLEVGAPVCVKFVTLSSE